MMKRLRPKSLDKPSKPPNRPTSGNGSQKVIDTQLVFHCQLAHGSPTALVTGFSNVKQLYSRIALEYELEPSEILFCTLNTYKINMNKILSAQLGVEDFIFAHQKGTPKELELIKESDAIGFTIIDNGAGFAIIKRIQDGSLASKLEPIQIGDHIEKINGISMVGKKHHEVAKLLKEIPLGSKFTIRLIEPMKSGYSTIGPKTSNSRNLLDVKKGTKTVRFKCNGELEIEEQDCMLNVAIEKINDILDSYYGVNDAKLATKIWELSEDKKNSIDFADAVEHSDLDNLSFTDDLIIEMWGLITDIRHGRIK